MKYYSLSNLGPEMLNEETYSNLIRKVIGITPKNPERAILILKRLEPSVKASGINVHRKLDEIELLKKRAAVYSASRIIKKLGDSLDKDPYLAGVHLKELEAPLFLIGTPDARVNYQVLKHWIESEQKEINSNIALGLESLVEKFLPEDLNPKKVSKVVKEFHGRPWEEKYF